MKRVIVRIADRREEAPVLTELGVIGSFRLFGD